MTFRNEFLPVPTVCDSCGSSNIAYVENDILYGKNVGNWPYLYFCHECRAAVGCHSGTTFPLGKMGDTETRALRSQCHNAFDPIWKTHIVSRSIAYNWLASVLEISPDVCHISWLTKEQLEIAIEASKTFYSEQFKYAERRIKKHGEQKRKRGLKIKRIINNRKKR
jgi:hypothetical protein